MAVVGATATGKSALALELARRLPGQVELVSMDSMQVYRGMDIGTAKPTPAERAEVPHHVIDVADPAEEWGVTRHLAAARAALAGIEARGRRAVLVGGTGLYVHALVDGMEPPGRWPEVYATLDADPDTGALWRQLEALDPVAASRMEPGNRRRVLRALEVTVGGGRPFSSYGPGVGAFPPTAWVLVGLQVPPDRLGERIAARFGAMMDGGLLEEVEGLARRPEGLSRTAAQALGYRELLAYLAGEYGPGPAGLDRAVDEAVRRTRAFARRQRAWWRRDPRIRWYDATEGNTHALGVAVLRDWMTT